MPDHRLDNMHETPKASTVARKKDAARLGAIDRRSIMGVVGLASAIAAATAKAQPVVRVRTDPDPGSLLEKLVDRMTFGATQEELALARSLGYQGYLEYHLNPGVINDSDADARTAPLLTIPQSYPELLTRTNGYVRNELIENVVLRAVYSKRQLFERMVELWTDHFNIDVEVAVQHKTVDDREVVRRYALSSFPVILTASAHSPAMLTYLNNDVSTAGNPNENYARELMELHTLDVASGAYTQQDVQEVARCLTGWTIWGSATDPLRGQFRFDSAVHDNAAKTVLGTPIPAGGGQNDGDTVLNLLASHPATARFIAFKICRHFLGYSIAPGIIDAVAQTYTQTGGDIKQMIRVALRPQHLASAGPKLKRPFHHFVSTLRALGTDVTATVEMRNSLLGAGHLPYSWQTPDGYPDKLSHWSGNVLSRWNWGQMVATASMSGVTFDDAAFFAGAVTADERIARIDERLFAGRMPASERARIRDYMLPEPVGLQKWRDAVGLAVGSPAFQWY